MLIMCWNVAGAKTTVNRIHDSYGLPKGGVTFDKQQAPGIPKRKTKSNKVLSEYLCRHGADILCLQEHKIPKTQLSLRSEPMGCSDVDGYESFWSCCVDPNKRGFNGVVTYVKKNSVPILSANSSPLGSPDLDEQGRCVMTDHGTFVLFNVYVPASSGQPLRYKMKFLDALRRAMHLQRTRHGKKVILVGDLNISHKPIDKFWSSRVLFVDDIRREVDCTLDQEKLPRWKVELASSWAKIENALMTKKVVPTKTTNSLTNKTYDKYRMTVQVGGKQVFLGSHESHPDTCEYYYDFDALYFTPADSDDQVLVEEANVVCISIVAELLSKVVGIDWSETLQRRIAATEGGTSRMAPPRRWLNAILQEDGMVDAFRHLYPEAEGRYTCWDQFTNKRYINEGARIDFTIVDSSLLQFVRKGPVEGLRCGCNQLGPSDVSKHNEASEVAALCAATSGGKFQPVSFQGGGIIEANQDALDSQFGAPHTGMIYTPPSFSDHIAISLLLDDECCRAAGPVHLDKEDIGTRRAQPHKSQKSLSSFFAVTGSPTSSKSNATSIPVLQSKNKASGAAPKRGIDRFFSSKASSGSSSGDISGRQEIVRTGSGNKRPRSSQGRNTSSRPAKNSILNHFAKK